METSYFSLFGPVESTCADATAPGELILLTPSGRPSAKCNDDFTFTLEKTVSLEVQKFYCKVQVSLDASKKPRMPKSYIDAVKPAAFGRVLGKATHNTGAQIKLTVQ